MKVLVYGAGIIGSLLAARLYEAGVDVTLLARGNRLASLRENGLQLAEEDSPIIRKVAVPITDTPRGDYDLIAVCTRTQHVEAVLESLTKTSGAVLFLLNWAAGPEPLGVGIGIERVLLGFPTEGGTMDGDVIRYRASGFLTRLVRMPIGEPDGAASARVDEFVRIFRSAGVNAKAEPKMSAWLTTHAAFEVPLGEAAHNAGGPAALARDTNAVRAMIGQMRTNLAAMPNRPTPGGFAILRILPVGLLVRLFRVFLRSSAAGPLNTTDPASAAELVSLAAQLSAL